MQWHRIPCLAALLVVLVVAIGGPRAAPSSAQDVTEPSGGTLFDGDLEHGLGAYDVLNGTDVRIVPDPHGLARAAARFAVPDRDRGPTADPRAQMVAKLPLHAGDEIWVGWSTLFPRRFPRSVPGWVSFASFYGPPFEGSGPLTFQVAGRELLWSRNATYGWDVPWRTPLIRGRWIDFVVHVRLAATQRRGFVELWVNTGGGWEPQALKGRRRLHTRTIDRSNGDGAVQHRLGSYRKRGMFRTVTLYQASHRIGTNFASVAPGSYR
jgi:Polysaccharide lyase